MNVKKNIILVTGCAGFIGYHLCKKLIEKKYNVIGIDNINNYYDIELKKDRLKELKYFKNNFKFKKTDISNYKILEKLFKKYKFTYVVNLAAQAGVRSSIKNPSSYVESNVVGFFNILDLSKKFKIKHLLFASTSSVYGNNDNFPSKESYNTDQPLSFYAATKKSNEVMAYSYSYIHKLPCTSLRFFTVYGPYGRPDMALFKFTNSIRKNKKIDVYNNGNHIRDFTYIDDVIQYILILIPKKPNGPIPYEVFNIGNSKPTKLMSFLKSIQKALGKKAKIQYKELQKGDVHTTHSSIVKLIKKTGYRPKISIHDGISKFINWHIKYYNK